MMHEYVVPAYPDNILSQIVLLERRVYVTQYEHGVRTSVLRASSKNVGVMKHGLVENKIISKTRCVTHYVKQNRRVVNSENFGVVIGG